MMYSFWSRRKCDKVWLGSNKFGNQTEAIVLVWKLFNETHNLWNTHNRIITSQSVFFLVKSRTDQIWKFLSVIRFKSFILTYSEQLPKD